MRRSFLEMENWQFRMPGRDPETVQLPHTWNAVDGQDGGNDYRRLACRYTHDFSCPDYDPERERVYIEFEGVGNAAALWLNDVRLGTHEGGYSTFRFDITSLLQKENHLEAEVDNAENARVYPQKADFTFYGGIYRPVRLCIVPKNHFALNYFGGDGVKITAKPAKDYRSGAVQLETWLETEEAGEAAEKFTVEAAVIAQDGSTVCTVREAAVGNQAVLRTEIPEVRLWQGVKDPYLYTAELRLYRGEVLVDALQKSFGVRDFFVDPEKGFFLNGKVYPLHGVSRHQDRKGLGNAITVREHEEDMALIRELGANTVRLAHYQHSQVFYDLCDRYGLVVWAEIPYISEHMPEGRENTLSQMKELIVQNYHHASICFWGISNEITISTKDHKDMMENHRILNDLCHEMDPGRLTTLACYAACAPWDPVVHKVSDLVGFNYYLGWYTPFLWLNDLFLKVFHRVYPKRRLCYSEYGAEAMPNLHSRTPRRGDHSEEYQLRYLEYMLQCFDRHPWMWGHYLWNMFDFAADARNQGGEPGMNHKGLVTFDRKTKKDSFYLYQAHWSEQPFVHLCGKRRADREEAVTEIKVYSNQKSVTLFVNGRELEKKSGDKIFVFRVPMQEHTEVKVQAGNLSDSAVFRKTAKPNPQYRLQRGQNKSANWT